MTPFHIRSFYPADPLGAVPGGVDTFLRGILKFAPPDLTFSLVGMTTDRELRPPSRWTTCQIGSRTFDFFPAVEVSNVARRSRVPLSLRYSIAVGANMRRLSQNFDVFEFHRIEPALLFRRDGRPKNAFFHQDMSVISTSQSDITWRHLPRAYFYLERKVAESLSSAWCVREEGVSSLQQRYSRIANEIRFVPTWVDTDIFSPLDSNARSDLRHRIAGELALDPASSWIISVGRLDKQKAPELTLSAFVRLSQLGHNVTWLVVGDGVLRKKLEEMAAIAGVSDRVRFVGVQPSQRIVQFLRVSDVFALSSAYEGMPMAVLEALGCGLPVAATDVGEIRRVVYPGVNGDISVDHTENAFSSCLERVLAHCEAYRGAPAVASIQPYQPSQVLAPVFDKYRELGVLARLRR